MNAIILAAGLGSRLRPLTLTTPKSQIVVNGMPMIERQIEYLKERGVDEIIIVTGYLHEKFEYLKEKYGTTLVHNDKFADYNNIYSIYLAKDYLGDSFVIDADIYMHTNFIPSKITRSTYFSSYKDCFDNEEWILEYDESTQKLNQVIVVKNNEGQGRIMSGVSFWSKKDAQILKEKLIEAINDRDFKNLYWDYMVVENLDLLDVYVEELDDIAMFEVDTLKDLKELEALLKQLWPLNLGTANLGWSLCF